MPHFSPVFAELSSPVFSRATAAGSFQGVPPLHLPTPGTPGFPISVSVNYPLFIPGKSGIEEGTLAQGHFSLKTPKPKPPYPVPTHLFFHLAAWTTIEDYNSQGGLRSSCRAGTNGRLIHDQHGLIRASLGEALSPHHLAGLVLPPPGPSARAPRPARLSSRALPSPFSLSEPSCRRVRTSLLQPPGPVPSFQPATSSREKLITYHFLAPYTLVRRAKRLQ